MAGNITNNKQKILNFKGLYAWQEAHKLVLMVYSKTKKFPKEELFALVSQLRRALISITSNLAEGFSRYSRKEKVQFYHIALGSLTESENQLILAKDLEYLDEKEFEIIENQIIIVSKLIRGLIKSLS